MSWLSDVSSAVRSLLRRPASAAAVVGILALGMSATTAMYAVFNAMLFRPTPGVTDPAGLVTIRLQPRDRSRNFSSFNRDHFVAFRDADAGLDGITAERRGDGWIARTPQDEPKAIGIAGVARRYFSVLGLRARLGRSLDDDDPETPGHRVVVISDALWRERFDASPDIVGRSIVLNGASFTIGGVVEAYRGWSFVFRTDLWLPLAEWPAIDPRSAPGDVWSEGFQQLFGRLRPGATPDTVEPRLAAVFDRVHVESPAPGKLPLAPTVSRGLSVTSQQFLEARVLAIFRIVSIGAFVLLALACANAANLLIVQSTRRRSELALRVALGSGRARLMRMLLAEASVQAAAAWAIGLGLAMVLAGTFRGSQLLPYVPALDDVGIDRRVLIFSGVVSAMTSAMFGVLPSWLGTSVDPRRVLGDSRTMSRPTHWIRSSLVAVQIAFSLALVVAAVVLFRSLDNLRTQPLGFDSAHVVEFDVDTGEREYQGARRTQFYRDALDRLSAIPGVEHVAFASPAPISTESAITRVRPADQPDAQMVEVTTGAVSPAYFDTLRIPLVAGRVFASDELLRPPLPDAGVIVVSRALAEKLFGTPLVVGRRLAITGRTTRSVEIVGVVGDVKWWDLRSDPRLMLYQPSEPSFVFATFLLRSSRASDETLAAGRAAMRAVAPSVRLSSVGTLDADLDHVLVEERLIARLMGLVAVFAGLIAVAGLYAVVAHVVTERTREIGIRIALGAPRLSIAGLVLRPVAWLAVIGSAAGLGALLAMTSLLAKRVYLISPTDPTTVTLAAAMLVAAALAAAWRPARRASRIDPAVTLRRD